MFLGVSQILVSLFYANKLKNQQMKTRLPWTGRGKTTQKAKPHSKANMQPLTFSTFWPPVNSGIVARLIHCLHLPRSENLIFVDWRSPKMLISEGSCLYWNKFTFIYETQHSVVLYTKKEQPKVRQTNEKVTNTKMQPLQRG